MGTINDSIVTAWHKIKYSTYDKAEIKKKNPDFSSLKFSTGYANIGIILGLKTQI